MLNAFTGEHRVVFDPIQPVDGASMVCISHCHPDHFDPEILSRFDRNAAIIVPKIALPMKAGKWTAYEEYMRFERGGKDDEARLGELLGRVVSELERECRPPRRKEAEIALHRFQFLKTNWDRMNSELRSAMMEGFTGGGDLPEGNPAPDPGAYIPPKMSGIPERNPNPDLGEEIRELGFQNVHELPPWGEYSLGGIIVTHVPANFANGITEQAMYLLESPAFTLFNGADAKEEDGVLSYVGRNYGVDIAFLPITGRTFLNGTPWEYRHSMDVAGAAIAARCLDAKCVVPYRDEIDTRDNRGELKGILPQCRILDWGDRWEPDRE